MQSWESTRNRIPIEYRFHPTAILLQVLTNEYVWASMTYANDSGTKEDENVEIEAFVAH